MRLKSLYVQLMCCGSFREQYISVTVSFFICTYELPLETCLQGFFFLDLTIVSKIYMCKYIYKGLLCKYCLLDLSTKFSSNHSSPLLLLRLYFCICLDYISVFTFNFCIASLLPYTKDLFSCLSPKFPNADNFPFSSYLSSDLYFLVSKAYYLASQNFICEFVLFKWLIPIYFFPYHLYTGRTALLVASFCFVTRALPWWLCFAPRSWKRQPLLFNLVLALHLVCCVAGEYQ